MLLDAGQRAGACWNDDGAWVQAPFLLKTLEKIHD
jgi:hypothetical protein